MARYPRVTGVHRVCVRRTEPSSVAGRGAMTRAAVWASHLEDMLAIAVLYVLGLPYSGMKTTRDGLGGIVS